MWVEVLLPLAIPKTYTYSVPPYLQEKLKIGCRAEVAFGKNKKYAGIISAISGQAPAYPTKDILTLIDEEPVVYPNQLLLWKWMAAYYMCTVGEVMAAALPPHLKLSSETTLVFNEEYGDDFSDLDDQAFVLAEALLIKKQLKLSEAQEVTDTAHVYPVIRRLIDKKVCFAWEALQEKYHEKKERYVLLNPAYSNEDKLNDLFNTARAPKQMELLLAYLHLIKTAGVVTQTLLLKKSGASAAHLKGLLDKDILRVERRSVDRVPPRGENNPAPVQLNEAQQKALAQVEQSLREKDVCLLHGITSSGKTQLYMKLIEQYVRAGKQVLYLLPEITLTAQILRRLQAAFAGITVYHSRFSNNERVELWNRTRSGESGIILGPRSALFLPFRDLGLIIIDEEHDPSFKQQEPAPRYNARDAAVYYATLFGAKVLMGSATPSVESYYNARRGKYGLVLLEERYGGIQLPEINIIDTRTVAGSRKGKVMISPQLKAAIEETLGADEQVILFQNRRGYAPVLVCGTCGYIPQCRDCDVTLTLHKFSNKLHCHYCGKSYPRLPVCPACGTANWMERNFGTEKIEEELSAAFPGHHIARMDVDAVKGKHAHDTLIKLFEQHRIDVLVGTQMVVKGLDFEKVRLVGILDADGLLSFADFRVNERAFQLMEQVSGRAGRKANRGKVLIQASKLQHPVLTMVQEHDYRKFYEAEIAERRQFYYPPYSRLIRLTLKHRDRATVQEAATRLGDLLRREFEHLVGPASPVVNRIRGLFLMEILLKLGKDAAHLQAQKRVIQNCIDLVKAEKSFRSVTILPDADPV